MKESSYAAIYRLMVAINKIDGSYYLCARKLGVKENTLALLYALGDGLPHSQKQISEDWLIPKTTINTIVKELADAGYLSLLATEDSREKTIRLTESGNDYAQ
ncbi:MAG TPA: MarR family transcriptional regulator, partial [Firmicutes bacterium]|nr:MarR family transcriptional regulator [Bacillota bacterium]